jgi:hypothetical protein
MRRRALLAALAGGLSGLSGCGTDSTRVREPTRQTPPPNVSTVTEQRPIPAPSGVQHSAAARSFVERHERRYVFNELVDGSGQTQPAVDVTVDPVQVAVVARTDRGYYLLSSCRGSVEYAATDGSSGGMTVYASSVAHFVGSGTHRRIPFNAYRCREPVVSFPDGSPETPAARFQLYDFETPPDADLETPDGHRVDVTVEGPDGEPVLAREYQTSIPLTVQPSVTRTPGAYTLTASLNGAAPISHDWSLSTPVDASWWALAVVITNGGELLLRTLYPNDAVGLPSSTLCRHAVGEGHDH